MSKSLVRMGRGGKGGRSDKGSLYTRLAPRALSDKLAQLSQTMSTDRTDRGPG